jgi:hypothetical protein
MEVVADRAAWRTSPCRPASATRRGDGFFVDIEPNVDFSFHVVCLSVRVSLDESERILAHYGAVLADKPSRAARDLMNDKHTASFQGCTRRSIADPQP